MSNEAAISDTPVAEEQRRTIKFDLDAILAFLSRPQTLIGIGLGVLIGAIFWPVIASIPGLWFNQKGYFQFAPLVPFAIGYIIWANWDKISKHKVQPSWYALPPLLILCYVSVIANQAGLFSVALCMLMLLMVLTVLWMLLGFKRAWALTPAVLFSTFALPFYTRLIDENTTNLQILSTDGAYYILQALGQNPLRTEKTIIHLEDFILNIAVACSGMKMTLALLASVVFIMLVARLAWWKNLILLAIAIPLGVFINSFRIASIGMVGNSMGQDNGMWFHDYGSYLFLALAFYLVYKIAVLMGWKV